MRVPIPRDASLGAMEVELKSDELEAETEVSLRVMSQTSFLVTTVDDVRAGRSIRVEARLLDDR